MPTSPDNNCLSLEQIRLYTEGKLGHAELHRAEDHLLSCPLCEASVEGYSIAPFASGDIPEFSGTPDAPAVNWLVRIGVPIILCTVVTFCFDLMRPAGKDPEPVISENPAPEPDDAELVKNIPGQSYKTEKLNDLIREDEEVKKLVTMRITDHNDLRNFGKIDPSPWIMPQPIGEIGAIHEPAPPVKLNIKKLSKDTFIHDLKVSNYRELYFFAKEEYESFLKSTDAKYESKELKTGDNSLSELTVITTADVLEKAMDNFSRSNFTDALKLYNILIKHEPGDVNALFYGALCYISLNRGDAAIEYLDRVITHPNNTFLEEAEWNKANALIQVKDFNAATNLLTKIISDKGFYAERAAVLQKKLKAKISRKEN